MAGFGLLGGRGQDNRIDWHGHHTWEPVRQMKMFMGSTGHPQVTCTHHMSPKYSPSIGLIQQGQFGQGHVEDGACHQISCLLALHGSTPKVSMQHMSHQHAAF